MEGSHKLMLERRQGGIITGVRDVTSFDEKEIRLVTEEGKLSVRGEGLHVKQLDLQKGEVELQGRIDQLVYLNKKQTGKWKKAL